MNHLDALRVLELSAADADRVFAAAKVLSEYGLGIAVPHKHEDTGEIVQLPESEVVLEVDCSVSFVSRTEIPANTKPVGWRFVDGKLSSYAECCAGRDDGPTR